MNVSATQSCGVDHKCERRDRFLTDKPEPVSFFQSNMCRVCLSKEVRMYHMSEHELSAMYERVVGVQIDTEDKLPPQLCWECVGRLTSANRFIQKALKTQWILTSKINRSGVITISDIESIDKARHKLESSLGPKFNIADGYDFLFTDETVEPNNCCNSKLKHINESADNDSREVISFIELNGNQVEQIFITEDIEIDTIKSKQVVDVKGEAHYYTSNEGTSKHEEEFTDIENVNFSNEEQAVSIKEESTSDDEVSGGDESESEMSKEERQVVDESSEVFEVIEQSHKGSNIRLPPPRNWRSKMPPGSKELVVLVHDIALTINNIECSSKQVTANVEQSTNHKTRKMRDEIPIKDRIIFEDDCDKVMDFSSDCEDTVKPPQSVINTPGTSHHFNTNTRMARNINKLILSGSEYMQKLFICDICDKPFDHKPTLILHIKKHPKTHYCTYCSYKTSQKGCLKVHVNAKHTKSKVFNCPHCSYKTCRKPDLSRHVNTKHTKSKVFNCPYCSYKAYQKVTLAKHVNSQHTKIIFHNCPYCNYKTCHRTNLSRHVSTQHTKSHVFNCAHCSYKTNYKANLSSHVNTKHTKSHVFNCAHCSYKTNYKGNLSSHVNTKHTKSQVFNCAHCSYKAYQNQTLVRHVNVKHQK